MFVLISLLIGAVTAFGAGNIPSFGQLEGAAFRHGDIEDILLQMIMLPSSGFFSSINPLSSTGKKFSEMVSLGMVVDGKLMTDYQRMSRECTLGIG